MNTPETIYLIPGEYDGESCLVWCDDPAPSSYSDPDDAVKYVRADIHESALKLQGNAVKMGMDAATKSAYKAEENAKRRLAKSNPAAIESERAANAELTEEIGHLEDRVINQGQQLREIVNITKGPPVDKIHSTHDAVESVERLHARVASLECSLWEAEDPTNPDAFILRKQAEAVHGLILKLGIYCESDPIEIVQEEVERLRNEAGAGVNDA